MILQGMLFNLLIYGIKSPTISSAGSIWIGIANVDQLTDITESKNVTDLVHETTLTQTLLTLSSITLSTYEIMQTS